MTKGTPTKLARIITLKEMDPKMTFDDIGRHPKIQMSRAAVTNNWNELKRHRFDPYWRQKEGRKKKSGQKMKISDEKLNEAVERVNSGELRDGVHVKHVMFPDVSERTVQRSLSKRAGLEGFVRWKAPMLNETHIAKRQAFAEEHRDWMSHPQSTFHRRWYIFVDESKFNLIGSDGRHWCRRKRGQDQLAPRNTVKKVKHGGGSIMVWGAITPWGTGRLHRIEGTLTGAGYVDIMEKSLIPTIYEAGARPDQCVIVQDNDPKHKSKVVQNWFAHHNIELLSFPPCSPDINLVENGWDQLDRGVRSSGHTPSSKDELWEMLKREWANISFQYIRSLYDSMPRRIEALEEAKGGNTKY